MRAFFGKMLAQLKEYFGKMSRGSRIRLAILSLVVIVLAIVAVVLLNRTQYVTMYTARDMAQAGTIRAALRDMGVPVKIEGTKILVPEGRVDELRAELSSQGVLGATDIDRSYLDSAAGFSVTDSHAKKLYEAGRASEIRGHIMASDRIVNCLVIVNFGESSSFRNPTGVSEPAVSVTLSIRGGESLSNAEAQTIAEIVRNSVPGISYERITITDTNFKSYKIGEGREDPETEMMSRVLLETRLSEQIQMSVEQLLSPVFGISNVRITPTVRLNFDKVVTESVEFDPPVAGEIDGIVRSSNDLWEAQRRDDTAEGIPGTDTNGMGTVEYPYGTLADGEMYERAVKERNYEINETRTIIEQAQGSVEFLSIAVLINSEVMEDDYSAQVTNLVSKGIGVSSANIAVERVPFAKDTTSEDAIKAQEEYEARIRRQELIETIIMWSVVLLLGLALIMLIRTIFKAVKPPPEPIPVLADGGPGIDLMVDEEEGITDVTEIEEVELQTKSTGLEQIERFIEKDPSAVAQLLRNWLTDE